MLSARTRRSANRVRQALKMAAMSLSLNGSAFYRRMCARMDKSSVNTATAHKLARLVCFMLTRGEDCRSGSAALQRAAAPAQRGRAQASCHRPRLRHHLDAGACMILTIETLVSHECRSSLFRCA